MKNLVLQPHVRRKIDERVDRLLRDLGHPEPPLRLEEVRALMRLDLRFYRSDDPDLVKETIHRLTMAGKQILARPTLLGEALRKCSVSALYSLDRKRIVIDQTVPKLKHRWLETHEIVHDLLEWHEAANYGDNEITVKQSCRDKIEAEANYGAGQLLFLRKRLAAEVDGSAVSVALVRQLAQTFGNTHASTLWRVVETAGQDRPLVGVIHYHPHPRFTSSKFDPANPCRHFIQSDAFLRQFAQVSEHDIYALLAGYCAPRRGGPLGESTAILTDDNGEEHEFAFETFGFGHECLTLGMHLRKRAVSVRVG
ncbi:MAG: hypothetical protein WC378_05890 [Opitutaceae bacterium]|jgi:hypothetical protein